MPDAGISVLEVFSGACTVSLQVAIHGRKTEKMHSKRAFV